jgi:hypothetical protein
MFRITCTSARASGKCVSAVRSQLAASFGNHPRWLPQFAHLSSAVLGPLPAYTTAKFAQQRLFPSAISSSLSRRPCSGNQLSCSASLGFGRINSSCSIYRATHFCFRGAQKPGRSCDLRVPGLHPQERIKEFMRSSRWTSASRPHEQRHAHVSPNQCLTTVKSPTCIPVRSRLGILPFQDCRTRSGERPTAFV